jgi:dienelactone hydrolase
VGEEHVVRRALWWSVGCAVLFTAFAAGTRRLRAHSPWQDDPYDVVLSFTQLLVPVLAVAVVVRIAGRRAGRPGPLRDLLRGGRALVGMVAATAVTDWVAVALRVHAGAWGGTGRLLIAALAVVTLAAAAGAVALRRATRLAGDRARLAPAPGDPDWADDVLAGAGELAGRCGAAGRAVARAVEWLRRVVVGGRHGLRRHRLATAVLAGVAVSACLTVAEALGDGLGPHPAGAAAARLVIGTAGLLTAALPLNAYLGVLRPSTPSRPADPSHLADASGAADATSPADPSGPADASRAADPSGPDPSRPVDPGPPVAPVRRPALVCAGYAVIASVPVTVGFRDGIGALVDYPVTSWGRLAGMITVVAALVGLITLLVQAIRRRRRRTAKALLAVPLAAVLLVAGTVAYLGVRHVLPRQLPAPTGPYRVGRAAYDWTDTGRTDPLAPDPGRQRELSVWVWYPAQAGASGPPAPYAPGHWAGMLQFGILANRLDGVRTHSVDGAPAADGRFPLVVLEPGMGLAAPQFSALAEDLASHGYVVAGVTPTYSANVTVLHGHPVRSSPAGNPPDFSQAEGDRLVPVWAADARFAADRMAGIDGSPAGHVDASRVVYIGHSFGGASSLQACHDDRRCAGAVDLDGTPYGTVVTTGLAAPMMLVGTPGDCLAGTCRPTDAAEREIDTAGRTLRAASTGPAFRYELTGAEHLNFSDYGAYYIPAPLHGLAQLGPIDGGRALVVVSHYVTTFLDHVLRGAAAPAPDRSYPEVRSAA